MSEYLLAIGVIGSVGLGKRKMIDSELEEKERIPTFREKQVEVIDIKRKRYIVAGKTLHVQYWVTEADKPEQVLEVSRYCSGLTGYAFIFDTNSTATFESLKFWLAELNKNGGCGIQTPKILIGNRLKKERCVDREEAKEWAMKISAQYFETDIATRIPENSDSYNPVVKRKIIPLTFKTPRNRIEYEDSVQQNVNKPWETSNVTWL